MFNKEKGLQRLYDNKENRNARRRIVFHLSEEDAKREGERELQLGVGDEKITI